MRAGAMIAIVLLLALAGCGGPMSPTEAGGPEADPVPLLTILPSPDDLRGTPAVEAGAVEVLEALLGTDDPGLASRLDERGLGAAGVRAWAEPGGELVAAVSVWESHLVATGVGADAASRLVQQGGGSSWTPSDVPGGRGSRLVDGARTERRLSFAVGPNSLYVRATGDVAEDVVIRTMRRLIEGLEGQKAG